MPQNGQAAVLKRSPIWKKMRKSFKTLSKLKLKFTPYKWFIENRDSNSTFILFHLNLAILFSCLKTLLDVPWVGVYLWYFFNKKREIGCKWGYLCQA